MVNTVSLGYVGPCLSGMSVRRRLHGSVPSGFRRNLDRGTAPPARPRPGRGPIWPGRRCRHRRQSAVRVVVAVPRRCTLTSPAGRRLASAPAALGTRPLVVFQPPAKALPTRTLLLADDSLTIH